MNCPACGGDTHVVNSRRYESSVYRMRECLKCAARVPTTEIAASEYKRFRAIPEQAQAALGAIDALRKAIGG